MAISSSLRASILLLVGVGTIAVAQGPDGASHRLPKLSEQMDLTPRPGEKLPLDMKLTLAEGPVTTLGEVLNVGRPTLIVPISFRCKVLCNNITAKLLKQVVRLDEDDRVVLGRDMNILMLDMKPTETVADAATRKNEVLRAADVTRLAPYWNWAAVSEGEMRKFAKAVGLKYRWDAPKNVLNHPIFTLMATPSGKISAYTIGPDVQDRLTERNLVAARNNELGEPPELGMKYGCVSPEPGADKHRRTIEIVVNAACVLTVIALFGSIVHMSRKYRQTPPGNEASR